MAGGLVAGEGRRCARRQGSMGARLSRGRRGFPILSMLDKAAHSFKPPTGAARTAMNAGPRPRFAAQMQFQLAADQALPLFLTDRWRRAMCRGRPGMNSKTEGPARTSTAFIMREPCIILNPHIRLAQFCIFAVPAPDVRKRQRGTREKWRAGQAARAEHPRRCRGGRLISA